MIVVKKLTKNILIFTAEHRYLGLEFGCRMTAIRLKNGDVILHSPVALDDDAIAQLNQLGIVRHIIAPSLFHFTYLEACIKAFPEAQVYGVKGLQKKIPNITFQRLDDYDYNFVWKDELNHFCLLGMPTVNETVFYHYDDKTLIVTDLLFNISKKTGWTKFVFTLYGVYNKLATTFLFKSLIINKPIFKKDIDYLKTLPLDHLILAHGDTISEQAQERFHTALEWV